MKALQRFFLFNVALFVTLSMMLSAQQIDMELLKSIEPRNIGPAGMSGRITAVDVVESNHDIMYAGSASGGSLAIMAELSFIQKALIAIAGLGAVSLPYGNTVTVAILVVVWAVLLPLLYFLVSYLRFLQYLRNC